MNWLKENEPLVYEKLEPEPPNKMDFKILRHYAHHTGRLYDGNQRWGVTGEAGAFLDPFYSPGTDFISMNNTWLSDLILREMKGEDVTFRAEIYEQTHLALVDSWIPIYKDKYSLMGKTQIMTAKILWDWAIYWAVPALMFTNKAFTDLQMLKKLFVAQNSLGQRFRNLHNQVQQLFLDWAPYDNEIFTDKYIDPVDLSYMLEFQTNIPKQHEGDALLTQISTNMEILEQVAVELFRRVSTQVKGASPDLKVNPYTMVLDAENKLNLPEPTAETIVEPSEAIKGDVDVMWFYEKLVTA
jgi:hypothetical protein